MESFHVLARQGEFDLAMENHKEALLKLAEVLPETLKIANNDGNLPIHRYATYNKSAVDLETFHELLDDLLDRSSELFPSDIRSPEAIRDKYSVFRTFRRSSDTRAIECGVRENDINVVNRWKAKEAAGTGKPTHASMAHYYSDLSLLKGPFKRYTQAM